MKRKVNHNRFRNGTAKVIHAVTCLEERALDQVIQLVNTNPADFFSSVTFLVAFMDRLVDIRDYVASSSTPYDISTPDPPVPAPPNDVEGFRQQDEADSLELFNNIAALVQLVRFQRDTLHTQFTAGNETIDNLEERITWLNLDLNIACATPAPTVAIPVATAPPPATVPAFRSEKFPDPEKFDATRTKLPRFITQLRMKLEVNHDRFRDEAAKVIYTVSRLEGRALDQVVPLVNANPAAPFSSVTAFVAHLEASFGDPDPRGTARHQLSQLLRIVAYLDYNEGAKIDALVEGLSEDLKDAMTYRTDKPNTVEAYATMLMTIDKQVRGRKAEQRAIRNTMEQFTAPAAVAHPSHTAGGLTPMDLSALQSRPTQRPAIEQRYTFVNGQRKTSAAEKQWRRDNNLCMYCANSGHIFDNCPSANRPRGNQPVMRGTLLAPGHTAINPAVSPLASPASSESGFQ
ncbi:uncharacterized protein H6S33_004534 [Morchella sextelata]|uniref:uncharacterized protein n=1 Tax=Morchella sextelata TaxID=1174677 RepID=UPI001D045A56|nr:uncharacterized protein H6S33_004534 [Morchella sextelata]KAH0605312.1 hypothetical protein H6S33_004534 [Morchella sextelata]